MSQIFDRQTKIERLTYFEEINNLETFFGAFFIRWHDFCSEKVFRGNASRRLDQEVNGLVRFSHIEERQA